MIIQMGTEVDESRILWKYKESDEWKRADIDDLIEAYEGRPLGEWIDISVFNWSNEKTYECSECGMLFDMDWYYCPKCGAKMIKEEADE